MRNRSILPLCLCLLILLAGGCATSSSSLESVQEQHPDLNRALFGQPVQVPEVDEIFALTGHQIEALDEFLSRQNDDSDLHWQLARFIDGYLSNFDYWGQTLNASQALQDQKGNCMSLAVVTAAFTRHLGLEHDFQLMRTAPTFERQSDLVLVSDHVRTRVYPPAADHGLAEPTRSTRRAIIDYFPNGERQPSRQVSTEEFLAMYYRNVAAERLLDNELETAFWFADRASTIHPDNASVLNLLAIIHRRAGDPDTAEALFRHAVSLHPNDVNLLHNLHALLENQGRKVEAHAVHRRLARLPDSNPYPHLLLARQLAEEGRLDRALGIYESVADRLPHMHEAYWGIAIVRDKQGDRVRAQRAMERALELARAPLHERLYSAKLHSLESGVAH